MHEALDARRRERGMTWQELAVVLRWTPSQFTGLKRVHLAIGMKLAMRVAQWLERPVADFVYAAEWWTRDGRSLATNPSPFSINITYVLFFLIETYMFFKIRSHAGETGC